MFSIPLIIKKDAHMAVLDAAGAPTILSSHASGMPSPFGKTALVDDQDRDGGDVCSERVGSKL
ncbi:hypothetical protein KTT_48850 [Tengunoibacter tsumagoiensis]|uniref:Uncharacterized protein n=1 Tax=Tengunoibacter tsumagoiensis TaxID=2014871 RepID=A0A402A7Q2_9CHLR|nr:hypothetical protein KTT_48850 [Tengunoibacter tsumagoiensis]